MASHGMDARKERILRAIIDDYIQTAMPVGSRTISRKYETSLSSATIRNEMSDLEELGYLAQPHVSAGRVPSVKAYRLYVDELLGGTLPQNPQARAFFSQRVRQMEDVITSAAQAISEFTHYTAVVMMPKQLELRVSTLQLVPMPRGAALLVIVTDTGAIRDTVIHVSESLDGDALYAISRMLTERLQGRTLQEVQEMLGAYSRQFSGDGRVIQGIAFGGVLLSLVVPELYSLSASMAMVLAAAMFYPSREIVRHAEFPRSYLEIHLSNDDIVDLYYSTRRAGSKRHCTTHECREGHGKTNNSNDSQNEKNQTDQTGT